MGFMDKVKAQAEQALAVAQQGVSQGQEKLDALQGKRTADGKLRELGAAYYAEQRAGGSAQAVHAALSALDEHVREHGAVDLGPSATDGAASGPQRAPGSPTTPTAQSASTPWNAPSPSEPATAGSYGADSAAAGTPTYQPPAPSFNQPQHFERPE